MKLLLDTPVLLWWLNDSPRLPSQMRELIADPERTVFISTATAWEIRIKQKLAKINLPAEFDAALDASEFHWLSIFRVHADATAYLPFHHRDPFDRMLIAQAQCDSLILLTVDQRLAVYGKNVLMSRRVLSEERRQAVAESGLIGYRDTARSKIISKSNRGEAGNLIRQLPCARRESHTPLSKFVCPQQPASASAPRTV